MATVTVKVTGLDELVNRLNAIEGAIEAWRGVHVRVGTNVNYAQFVHDGTRYMKGRPFLTDAVVTEQSNVEQDVRNGLETVINGGDHGALKAAFLRAGLRIQATAQRNTPVKTGTLRRSLHTDVS